MSEFVEDIRLVEKDIDRVSTGLKNLDELLSGGLPQNSITLVSGTPGSGKTIMCFHYIAEGLKNGEKCLYLTSDERINNIIAQAKELGFDFQPAIDRSQLKLMYVNLDKSDIHKEMEKEIKNGDYCRVVMDSLAPIAEAPIWMSGIHEIIPSETSMITKGFSMGSIPATRVRVCRIMSILSKENNCTVMLTSEIPEGSRNLSRDTISEFLVDGIILLDLDMTMDRRKLSVRKMRATKHTLKPQDIVITDSGIKF